MGWLTFIPLPFLIADLLACREQRASRREGREALRQLRPEDRRVVGRALRRGEGVADPRLAAATIAWTRSLDVRCVWGTLFYAVFLGTYVVGAAAAMVAREWRTAAEILLGFDFFALLGGVADVSVRRAKSAERATGALHLG